MGLIAVSFVGSFCDILLLNDGSGGSHLSASLPICNTNSTDIFPKVPKLLWSTVELVGCLLY